jgi:hypothetical protein
MSASPVYVGMPKRGLVQILNADASNLKTVVSAGASGSKVCSLSAASDDTSQRLLQVYITRSGTSYLVVETAVPAASGSDGSTPAVNLINSTILPGLPVDNDGVRYLFLQSGDTLQVKSTTTVTSGKIVHLASDYGDL